MPRLLLALPAVVGLAFVPAAAQDTPAARPLFNGTDFTGWRTSAGAPVTKGWAVKDGAMVREGGGGDILTKDRFGDFVLELEYKTAGNSGVFFRTDNPKDNVQTGIEIQVDVPRGKTDKHSVGAIYDLVAPTKENAKANDWNAFRITARGPHLKVESNGEVVAEMDLDRWAEGGKNPDGTPNKYRTALKDFKREGHIGFQDHGGAVSYRNVRLREVK
ncbi:MAG TPA: DUF1080 domain-containing protein [Urbifossiella sp.]|jgi:hypothetical protein|nr:DUF1080 domain-containing protein [Urbifossiella sp.]